MGPHLTRGVAETDGGLVILEVGDLEAMAFSVSVEYRRHSG